LPLKKEAQWSGLEVQFLAKGVTIPKPNESIDCYLINTLNQSI
jgi:hypothetical protein